MQISIQQLEALYLLSHGQILCRARFYPTQKACCRVVGEGFRPFIIHSASAMGMIKRGWIKLSKKTKNQDQYTITDQGKNALESQR